MATDSNNELQQLMNTAVKVDAAIQLSSDYTLAQETSDTSQAQVCKVDPTYVPPDWRKRTECRPFLNKQTCEYWFTFESEYESTGGDQLEARLEESKEPALIRLLQFYNKKSDEDTISSIIDNVNIEGHYVDPRPCSPMLVLVTLSHDILHGIDNQDPPEIELPQEGFYSVNLDLEVLKDNIKYIADQFNRLSSLVEKSNYKIVGINLRKESKRIRKLIQMVENFVHTNNSSFEELKTLELVFDSEYKLLYALSQETPLMVGVACFKKHPLLQHPRTVFYLVNLYEMESSLRTTIDFSWSDFVKRFVLNAQVVSKTGAPDESLTNPSDIFSFDIDINVCKSKEEKEAEDRAIFNESTRARVAQQIREIEEFVGDWHLKNLEVVFDADWSPSMDDLMKILERVNIACMIQEALQCCMDELIENFGAQELIDVDLNLDKIVKNCQFEGECDLDIRAWLDGEVGLKRVPTINIPDYFPTTNYLAEVILEARKKIIDIIAAAIIEVLKTILENIFACGQKKNEGFGTVSFNNLLEQTLGLNFNELADSAAWKEAMLNSGHSGLLGIIGETVSEAEAGIMDVEIDGVTISDAWLDAISDASLVLTPGEQVSLYRGEATEEVCRIVTNCVLFRHPELAGTISNEVEMCEFFSALGDLIDSDVLNAASTLATESSWVGDLCELPDETPGSSLRTALLTAKGDGITKEQIEEQIQKEKDERYKCFERLQELADNPDGFMAGIFPEIFGSEDSVIDKTPDVIDHGTDLVLDAIFDNVAITYNQDVVKWLPGLYTVAQTEIQIENTTDADHPNGVAESGEYTFEQMCLDQGVYYLYNKEVNKGIYNSEMYRYESDDLVWPYNTDYLYGINIYENARIGSDNGYGPYADVTYKLEGENISCADQFGIYVYENSKEILSFNSTGIQKLAVGEEIQQELNNLNIIEPPQQSASPGSVPQFQSQALAQYTRNKWYEAMPSAWSIENESTSPAIFDDIAINMQESYRKLFEDQLDLLFQAVQKSHLFNYHNLKYLNLAPAYEDACGRGQPVGLFNTHTLKDQTKEFYASVVKSEYGKTDSISAFRRSAIAGITYATIRLYLIELMLKNMFVLSNFKASDLTDHTFILYATKKIKHGLKSFYTELNVIDLDSGTAKPPWKFDICTGFSRPSTNNSTIIPPLPSNPDEYYDQLIENLTIVYQIRRETEDIEDITNEDELLHFFIEEQLKEISPEFENIIGKNPQEVNKKYLKNMLPNIDAIGSPHAAIAGIDPLKELRIITGTPGETAHGPTQAEFDETLLRYELARSGDLPAYVGDSFGLPPEEVMWGTMKLKRRERHEDTTTPGGSFWQIIELPAAWYAKQIDENGNPIPFQSWFEDFNATEDMKSFNAVAHAAATFDAPDTLRSWPGRTPEYHGGEFEGDHPRHTLRPVTPAWDPDFETHKYETNKLGPSDFWRTAVENSAQGERSWGPGIAHQPIFDNTEPDYFWDGGGGDFPAQEAQYYPDGSVMDEELPAVITHDGYGDGVPSPGESPYPLKRWNGSAAYYEFWFLDEQNWDQQYFWEMLVTQAVEYERAHNDHATISEYEQLLEETFANIDVDWGLLRTGGFFIERYIRIKDRMNDDNDEPRMIPNPFGTDLPNLSMEKYIDTLTFDNVESLPDHYRREKQGLFEVSNIEAWQEYINSKYATATDAKITDEFKGWSVGLRLCYVSPLPEMGPYTLPGQYSEVVEYSDRNKNKAYLEKAYQLEEDIIVGTVQEGNQSTWTRTIHTIPLVSTEVCIDDQPIANFIGETNLVQLYNNAHDQLLDQMIESAEYKLLFNYCLPLKRHLGLVSIYNNVLLSDQAAIENVFDSTKLIMKQMFDVTVKGQGYDYQDQTIKDAGGQSGMLLSAFATGQAGSIGKMAVQMLLSTPIKILEALIFLIDPNLIWARCLLDTRPGDPGLGPDPGKITSLAEGSLWVWLKTKFWLPPTPMGLIYLMLVSGDTSADIAKERNKQNC